MILVMGHRGSSGYAPENTLTAFQMAVDSGADGIECDIHWTKDHQFVVCHDETIDRTSDGTGRIPDMTLAEIKEKNFACKFHPHYFHGGFETAPTLSEMLDVVKDMKIINIEIKEFEGDEAKALDDFYAILTEYGVVDHTIVSSFNVDLLARLKEAHADVKTGYLYHPNMKVKSFPVYPAEQAVQTALAKHCDAIHPEIGSLSAETVSEAHANGLEVNCWTANNRKMAQKAIDIGCDGIISNYPDWVMLACGK